MTTNRTVLAAGIDAAEPRLVADLIERGELPALARLRDQGTWARVRSPAHIGSGAVWPTFMTGREPHEHGVYADWNWSPERMGVVPALIERLDPFWRQVEADGMTAGVLDVEFAPHVGLSRGFEVTEWGAHYAMQGPTAVSPAAVAAMVEEDHPFRSGRFEPGGDDRVEHGSLSRACVAGASARGGLARRLIERTRPDLAVILFVEAHRASEDLWHTVDREHPLYEDLPPNGMGSGLVEVYREVDRQVGLLIETVGDDAPVMVFSLHGMQPGRGIPTLLEPALHKLGFACPPPARPRSPRDVAHVGLAAVKRRIPAPVKRLYHRRVPRSARYRLAAPTMLPLLDWSATRAFSLPTDQHGWVRINLRGREAQGAVAPSDYDRTCEELRGALLALATEDGRALVADVVDADPTGSPPALLPDLVVHWTDAAFDRPVRVAVPALEQWPLASGQTGQHASEGFCLARGIELGARESVRATELHALLRGACGR